MYAVLKYAIEKAKIIQLETVATLCFRLKVTLFGDHFRRFLPILANCFGMIFSTRFLSIPHYVSSLFPNFPYKLTSYVCGFSAFLRFTIFFPQLSSNFLTLVPLCFLTFPYKITTFCSGSWIFLVLPFFLPLSPFSCPFNSHPCTLIFNFSQKPTVAPSPETWHRQLPAWASKAGRRARGLPSRRATRRRTASKHQRSKTKNSKTDKQ